MCTRFFFFKQKTAYELRISDWSSDVCSSDLTTGRAGATPHGIPCTLRAAAAMPKAWHRRAAAGGSTASPPTSAGSPPGKKTQQGGDDHAQTRDRDIRGCGDGSRLGRAGPGAVHQRYDAQIGRAHV